MKAIILALLLLSANARAAALVGTSDIKNGSVTNAKLAVMNNSTVKCNVSGGSASPADCTSDQATALVNVFVGDTGSGGAKGLVPAPAAGDAGLAKFAFAGGTWSIPQIPINPTQTYGAVIYSNGATWGASTVAIPACVAIAASNIDWSLGNCFTKTLSGNTVFTMTKRGAGQTIMVRITNPSTYTVTWPNTATLGNSVLWVSSTIPTQSTTNKTDIWTVFFDGAQMFGAQPTQGY